MINIKKRKSRDCLLLWHWPMVPTLLTDYLRWISWLLPTQPPDDRDWNRGRICGGRNSRLRCPWRASWWRRRPSSSWIWSFGKQFRASRCDPPRNSGRRIRNPPIHPPQGPLKKWTAFRNSLSILQILLRLHFRFLWLHFQCHWRYHFQVLRQIHFLTHFRPFFRILLQIHFWLRLQIHFRIHFQIRFSIQHRFRLQNCVWFRSQIHFCFRFLLHSRIRFWMHFRLPHRIRFLFHFQLFQFRIQIHFRLLCQQVAPPLSLIDDWP